MTETPKTISEWEQEYGLYIVDLDGFDTRDPQLYQRRYTRDEFEAALAFCTVVRRNHPKPPAFDEPASTPTSASEFAGLADHNLQTNEIRDDDPQTVDSQADERAVSLEGWPSTVPPQKLPRTGVQGPLDRLKARWEAWLFPEDEQVYDEFGDEYDDSDDEAYDDEISQGRRDERDKPATNNEIPPLSTLAADAKASVQDRVVRPFAVRWRSRAFRRFFILFTLPTLAVFLMDALYALLSRVIRVRWYWPVLVLATDALIVFIAPLAPLISGPLYLWYVVLGLLARFVGVVLHAVVSALPFLHGANVPFTSGPFLNNVTLFGNRLPLYFHFGTAVTSGLVWGTVISSVQHLWVSRGRGSRA